MQTTTSSSSSASSSASASASASTSGASTRKDASHVAFYAGMLKGAYCAIDGLILFFRTPEMLSSAKKLIIPMLNLQAIYIGLFSFLFIFILHQPATIYDFLSSLWRWSRILTVILMSLLDLQRRVNIEMFFMALKYRAPQSYSTWLQTTSRQRTPIRIHLLAAKRIIKITLFKSAATLITWFIPNAKFIALPTVRFLSMVPILGTPVAAIMAAIHILPTHILEQSIVDDAIVSFGEAVIDADEYGSKLVNRYTRKIDVQTRQYFTDRFRGYIVGCGFVYSLLSAIPFLGIPIALISECGAACLVVEVTKRNLTKHNRLPLPGEQFFSHTKES